MATPNERLIATNLQTTLAAISVAGGYKSTVQTCSLLGEDFEGALSRGQLPYIGISPGQVTYDAYMGGFMRCVATWDVVAHLRANTISARYDAIENLTDDIIKALYTDVTRGGAAMSTHVKRKVSNLGDPDAKDHASMVASLAMTIEVSFHRTIEGT